MPMLEVMLTELHAVSNDAKRAFADDVAEVLHDVLGTPRERVQLLLRDISPNDCGDTLLVSTREQGKQGKT